MGNKRKLSYDELDWMCYELERQRHNLLQLAAELKDLGRPHSAEAARYSATRIGHVLNALLSKEPRYTVTAKGKLALRPHDRN